MSQSTSTHSATRPDPLINAYRQASVHEGASPGTNVRAAVLAHARVVAQSSGATVTGGSVANATRATPAANDSKPLWRLAAGVVIGLVGVWIFQLTRPSAAPDTVVAVANVATAPTAPQPGIARAAEPAVIAATASPPPAAAAPPVLKDRAAKPVNAAREQQTEAALPEQNLAMASASLLKEKADRAAGFAGVTVTAAPAATPTAPMSAADASAGAMRGEVVIASAEMRKSAKAESRPEPSSTAPDVPAFSPAAAPNAFPAQASEVAIAAAPPFRPAPATLAAPAEPAAPLRAGASGAVAARGEAAPANAASAGTRPKMSIQMNDATRIAPLSESDIAMFRAVSTGDIPALRIAISRGAHVNGKDERGRTPLQIARERADVESIKVLEAVGAR